MNTDTLWDRANDAINTIIRRDEGTETEGLLPPCVEGIIVLISLHFVDLTLKLFCWLVLILKCVLSQA